MARTRRPPPIHSGDLRVGVVRGPAKDNAASWYWRARRFEAGAEVTIWTGWGTRAEVEQVMAGMLLHGEAPATERCDTVEDLLLFWRGAQDERGDLRARSKDTIRAAVRQLVHGLGTVRVAGLRMTDLEGYRDRRLRPAAEPLPARVEGTRGRQPARHGASPFTVERELRFLAHAWSWGQGVGLVPATQALPTVRIRMRETRTRHTPTRAEVKLVLARLDGWAALTARLLFATGCRLGEVASLHRRDVDERRLEIRVDGKTGPRAVPVHPDVMAELLPLLPTDPSSRVIPDVRESTVLTSLRRHLDQATGDLGMPRWTAQDLRRAAVDELYRAGADPSTVAAILGHSVETAMKFYRRPTEDDRHKAVRGARLGLAEAEGKVVEFPRRG
jgi:integrase